MARWTKHLSLAIALLVSACDPGSTTPDAGPPPTPSLEIGTGEGQFRAFPDGDTLDLVRGCQGSQHVWVALRAASVEPTGTIIDLSIRRASDDVVVSQIFHVRISLRPVGNDPFLFEQYGLTAQIPDPETDMVVGQDLILSATVTDADGVEVSGERPIQIEWGPGC